MGLINWMMHRNMQKDAEGLVEWAATAYHTIRSQQPTMSERDVLGSILDQRGSFPGGDEARNKVLD